VKLSSILEKLAGRLPKNLRGALLDHFKTLRELIEGEIDAARKSTSREVKLAVTKKIIGASAALCTTVGVEPIPLADFPVLTTLQVLMVGSIMHVSGRQITRKAIAEFLGALGLNIGVGILFRESARAAIKLLPGFGSAISGAVAGGATYALGRAANAYFIEDVPLPEVRKFFRKSRPKPPLPPQPPQLPEQ
jgi:uncharacterized protein (DUF697 family)